MKPHLSLLLWASIELLVKNNEKGRRAVIVEVMAPNPKTNQKPNPEQKPPKFSVWVSQPVSHSWRSINHIWITFQQENIRLMYWYKKFAMNWSFGIENVKFFTSLSHYWGLLMEFNRSKVDHTSQVNIVLAHEEPLQRNNNVWIWNENVFENNLVPDGLKKLHHHPHSIIKQNK